MKYFCCECGRRVPQKLKAGKWEVQKCAVHPGAKRYSETFAAGWFRRMHDICTGELAAVVSAMREARKPYLKPHVSDLLAEIGKGGAL